MLGAQQTRFSAVPGRNKEHVILSLPVFGSSWLLEDGNLLERTRPDPYLFPEFTTEGRGGGLVSLAVSTDQVPYTWVERTVLRALSEKDLVPPNQETARAVPHGPR